LEAIYFDVILNGGASQHEGPYDNEQLRRSGRDDHDSIRYLGPCNSTACVCRRKVPHRAFAAVQDDNHQDDIIEGNRVRP